jgi:hypothetical protein
MRTLYLEEVVSTLPGFEGIREDASAESFFSLISSSLPGVVSIESHSSSRHLITIPGFREDRDAFRLSHFATKYENQTDTIQNHIIMKNCSLNMLNIMQIIQMYQKQTSNMLNICKSYNYVKTILQIYMPNICKPYRCIKNKI